MKYFIEVASPPFSHFTISPCLGICLAAAGNELTVCFCLGSCFLFSQNQFPRCFKPLAQMDREIDILVILGTRAGTMQSGCARLKKVPKVCSILEMQQSF